MTISSQSSANGDELTINIEGRFDFSCHQEFRRSYEGLKKSPSRYRVDMCEASYLDSSALGMLLLLRDYAGAETADIHIVNCSDSVKKILAISNFEQLFTIN